MQLFLSEANAARRALPIKMVDSTDGVTTEPGITVSVQIRKNGGTWTAGAGSVTEPGGAGNGLGSYEYTATQAELNTIGIFEYQATGTGCRRFDGLAQICAQDPNELLATATALATVQADTDNIQTRIPASLVSGRMDSSVGAVATGAIAAAAFAANAINAAALATDAVTEIQTGLATAAALATVQADTDNIQTRIPAALVGGRMDSSVGAMVADVLTASALATDAVTEIQTGLATASALATVQADTDSIQASLASGVTVAAIATGAITAASTSSDFVSEIANAIDALLSTTHGPGSWEGSGGGGGGYTPAQIWAHVVEGSLTAEQLIRLIASVAIGRAYNLKSSQPVFRDLADTKNRIVASITQEGNNRTITSIDGE